MREQLVQEKINNLKAMSRTAFIDHVANYPNRQALDYNLDGTIRRLPLGAIAEHVRNIDYQMSDKQYHTLIHEFSNISVQELDIEGTTSRPNYAIDFEKRFLSEQGRNTVYETTYRLQPEPDKNAVKVLVRNSNERMREDWHHLGYLGSDFVGVHPITEEMDVPGTMTDPSGGLLKNMSYSLIIDTETLDLVNAMKSQTVHTEAGKPQVPVYERSFRINGYVTDIDAANRYLSNSMDLSRELTVQLGFMGKQDPSRQPVGIKAEMKFENDYSGTIRIMPSRELDAQELNTVRSYTDYLQRDGRLDMRMEDFATISANKDTFAVNPSGFQQPGMQDQNQPSQGRTQSRYAYHMPFQFRDVAHNYPVSIRGVDGAKAFLDEKNATATHMLKKFINNENGSGRVAGHYGMDYLSANSLSGSIESVSWNMDSPASGHVCVATNKALDPGQLDYVSQWVRKENAIGIGAEFTAQPFALHAADEFHDIPFPSGISSDESRLLEQVSGPGMKVRADLGLTENDLKFAEEMSRSGAAVI